MDHQEERVWLVLTLILIVITCTLYAVELIKMPEVVHVLRVN